MRAHPSPADFLILAGLLLLFSGCTVVNYCIGTHMDEWRAGRHVYRKGSEHMIRHGHEVTVITTGGATLHATLVGTKTVEEQTMAYAVGDHSSVLQNPLLNAPGQPDEKGTVCICLAMPDSTTLEIPMEEVYLVRAEYGPPHLWRRALPIPGLVFDAAAVLVISGLIAGQ